MSTSSLTPKAPTSILPNISGWETYTNPTYGYIFAYPSSYNFYADKNGDYQSIKDPTTNTGLDLAINIGVDNSSRNYGTSMQDFINQAAGIVNANGVSVNLGAICDAYGESSQYCDKILKQSEFTNPNGINCYELYLEVVENDNNPNPNSNSILALGTAGPLYACDITHQTNNKARALLISPLLSYDSSGNLTISPQEITEVKDIINSIHF